MCTEHYLNKTIHFPLTLGIGSSNSMDNYNVDFRVFHKRIWKLMSAGRRMCHCLCPLPPRWPGQHATNGQAGTLVELFWQGWLT